jgi:hypothetical protein
MRGFDAYQPERRRILTSLPIGQPRFWVESRKTAQTTSGVWYRANTLEEAHKIKEFLKESGNKCIIIHEWIGLRYAPVDGIEEKVQFVAVPFWE